MANKIKNLDLIQPLTGPIDCACLIHGDAYPWIYVERLYNMLQRHISCGVRLHVYTESTRTVPEPMIKHELKDWGIGGAKRSWWYKIQIFNSVYHAGPLLYFDLDTVIVDNIDWIWHLPLRHFWTLQDFKYLWRKNFQGINSSVMWWDTRLFDHVYTDFKYKNLASIMKQYQGDQDYLTRAIEQNKLRFLDPSRVQSWRWQCLNGGYDFAKRTYKQPNSGATLSKNTSILIFHGTPKPIEVADPVVLEHWK